MTAAARLDADPAVLCIEVEDATEDRPRQHALHGGDPARPGGRGWTIVRRVALTCTVQLLPGGGKRITVTLPVC
ncbi:hypothetical protein [Kitasatospora sp. NPDC048538]|uniref:hypothetical protein n=1 Tax=unclassified Kitasatospora TaxID=2633591 RepID=UPI0033CE3D33